MEGNNMIDYKNQFLDMDEDQLRVLYVQYLDWYENAVIPKGTELARVIDRYCEMFESNILLVLELDLLRAIAQRWSNR